MAILSLRIYGYGAPWCVDISSRRGQASTLLILMKGQCEGLTVGISARETNSHVFFVSKSLAVNMANR